MVSEELKKKLVKARNEIREIKVSASDNVYGYKNNCVQDVNQVTEAFYNHDDLSDNNLISCVKALIALFLIRAELF